MKVQNTHNDGNKLVKVVLIIFILYILPVVLMLIKIIPFEYRFYVLEIATVSVFIYSMVSGVKFNQLGFTRRNFKASVLNVLPMTVLFSIPMILGYFLGWIRLDNSAIPWQFYLFFVFISSPSQEFLYRGFLFHIFSEVDLNKQWRITLSSVLYSFVHAIYLDIPTLVLTLIIGLFWGLNYDKFRNISSVILSHSILGAIAILVGLI